MSRKAKSTGTESRLIDTGARDKGEEGVTDSGYGFFVRDGENV